MPTPAVAGAPVGAGASGAGAAGAGAPAGASGDAAPTVGAPASADGTPSAPESATGTAGETRTFSVTLNGDTKVEADETFSVSLNTVSNAAVVITDTATGTILNDDSAALTIANITQPENGTFTFTATLNNATAGAFSADWVLGAGTTNAADYAGGMLPGAEFKTCLPGGSSTSFMSAAQLAAIRSIKPRASDPEPEVDPFVADMEAAEQGE